MRAHILLGLTLSPAAALAEPPQILTDMPVTASLVEQVMGDLGDVGTLLESGSNPHDFQMRPSQARALQDAELLIWMGPEMTAWLEDAATSLGDERQVQLLHLPGTHVRKYGDDHEHAEHGSETEDDHDHDHSGIDPHAWLDPENGRLWLTLIAERLSELDPENEARYRSNAAAAAESIAQLDIELVASLSETTEHPFVTFHDAYGYFTEHYDLPDAVTVAIGDATSPSASRLQSVRETIQQSGARCAYPETGQSARMIEAVTEGMPLTIGKEISPTGAELPAGSTFYGDILTQLAKRLSDCEQATE